MRCKRTLSTFFTMVAMSTMAVTSAAYADGKASKTVKVERAAAAYKRGVAAYKDKKFFDAEVEFEAARQLAPRPTLIYNLALTKVKVGKSLEAAELFEEVIVDSMDDPDLVKLNSDAKNKLDEVAAKLSRLVMDIKDAQIEVSVDGKVKNKDAFFIMPGRHVVKAVAGSVESTWKISLSAGEERVIAWEPGTQETKMELRVGNTRSGAGGSSDDDEKGSKDKKDSGWFIGFDAGGIVNAQNINNSLSPLLGVLVSNGGFTLGADVILASEFEVFVFRPNLRVRLAPYIDGEIAASISTGEGSFVAGSAGLRITVPLSKSINAELAAFASFGSDDIGFSVPIIFNLSYNF